MPEMMDSENLVTAVPKLGTICKEPLDPQQMGTQQGHSSSQRSELAQAPLEQLLVALNRDTQVTITVALGSR